MRLLWILLVFFLPIIGHSQNDLYAKVNKNNIGVHLQTLDSIYATDISYSWLLDDFRLDASTGLLLLRFVEAGHDMYSNPTLAIHAVYDYTKNEMLWTNASKKDKTFFNIVDDRIFFSMKDGTGLWDIHTKEFKWKLKSPIYTNRDLLAKNLCIAPSLKDDGTHFAGIDINSGEAKWKTTDINLLGNIIGMPLIMDSTLFFINENLIAINIHTGKYKRHEYGFNSVAREGGGGATALILGGLVGYTIYDIVDNATSRNSVKTYDHFVKHHSNYLVDSFIYIGAMSHLLKFDKQGNEVAKIEHYQNKNSGESELFHFGGQKCFINFGYSIAKGKRTSSANSHLFIERFDDSMHILKAITYRELKEKYYNGINGEIIDFRVIDHHIYLLFRNARIVLDTNFDIVSTKVVYADEKWANRMREHFYYRQDSIFHFIDMDSTEGFYVLNVNGSVSCFNLNGDLLRTIPKKDIFYETYSDEKIKVIGYMSDDYILDNNHRLLLALPGIYKVAKNGKDYIFGFPSGFLILDENQLIR